MWRGVVGADLRRRLWLIFGLGALQGAVGWWMVASGLSQRVEVSQYRLATHLVLALLIFAAIVWTLRRLTERPPLAASARLKITSVALVALTFVQLYLGALVAGLRAGKIYNTWPDIDGAFIPSSARLFFEAPWWRNLFDNTLTVQFEHRMMAYALLALAILHAFDAIRSRAGTAAVSGAWWLALAITVQAALGIVTLLNQVPMDLALAHQAVAIAVLTLAILQAERLAGRQAEQERARSWCCRSPKPAELNASLAVAVNAAGVGQAVPIGNIGAAVIRALVVVGIGRSIIARQQRCDRQAGDVWDIRVSRCVQRFRSFIDGEPGRGPRIGVGLAKRNGGSEIVMRPGQARRQSDGGAMPAMVDQRPVGAFSGSAGDHAGKQCNRKTQHRLLRNDGFGVQPVYPDPFGRDSYRLQRCRNMAKGPTH